MTITITVTITITTSLAILIHAYHAMPAFANHYFYVTH